MNLENLSLRKIIYIGIAAIVLIAAAVTLVFLWLHGRLSITIPEDAHTITIIDQSNGEVVQENEAPDEDVYNTILRTGDYEVRITSEDTMKRSSYFVTIHSFLQTTSRDGALHNQGEREKVGKGSLPCPVFEGNTLYSYTCSEANYLEKAATLSTENTLEVDRTPIPGIIEARSYKDGILILQVTDMQDAFPVEPNVLFFKDGQVAEQRSVPDELNLPETGSKNYDLTINQSDPEKFLVSRNNNQIVYAFDDFDAEPQRIDVDSIESTAQDTQISNINYTGSQISIMTGYQQIVHDTPGNVEVGDDIPQNSDVIFQQYTIDNGEVDQTNRHTIADHFIEEAVLCGAEYMCLYDSGVISIVSTEDPSETVATIHNAATDIIPVTDTEFLYIQDDRVMLMNLDTLSSRQLYYTDNFTVSTLTPSQEGIILNAYLETGDRSRRNELYSFSLSTSPSESNTFIDQVLPYPSGALDGIIQASDYYRNQIEVKLQLTSWRSEVRINGGQQDYTFDREEFEQKRDTVLEQLESQGITQDEYDIEITP